MSGLAEGASLRDLLSRHPTLPWDEAVRAVAQLASELALRHGRGERHVVIPASIHVQGNRWQLRTPFDASSVSPVDVASLAPEIRATREPGDARASVYALAAILYECIVREPFGSSKKRPRDVQPSIPDALEIALGLALVEERAQRPDDLHALATALLQSVPAEPTSLEIEVDINVSMLPPAPMIMAPSDPFGSVVELPPSAVPAPSSNVSVQLAALKAKLEGDPKPRYVVVKDHVDHGPFTAVELLRQIADRHFQGSEVLRDNDRSSPIESWVEFAPFVEQARLTTKVEEGQKAVARAAADERRGGATKIFVGIVALAAIASCFGYWLIQLRGKNTNKIEVASDRQGIVDVSTTHAASRKTGARPKGGGGPGGASAGQGGGGAGGTSFENILDNNNEEMVMGQAQTPDLTKAQLAGPLSRVSFVSACGAPDNMKVTVRVAVRMGRAVGVTVGTNPPSGSVAACIDSKVRGLAWPSSPKTDFVTTVY